MVCDVNGSSFKPEAEGLADAPGSSSSIRRAPLQLKETRCVGCAFRLRLVGEVIRGCSAFTV